MNSYICFKLFSIKLSQEQCCDRNKMELSCLLFKKVCFSNFPIKLHFLCGILVLCMISSSESATIPNFANETERLALLDLKNKITEDPLKIMSLWNDSIHLCNWVGVTCSSSNGRVLILNLEGRRLGGSIPPSIGNLTFLTGINLKNNSFRGEIPQDVGRLLNLQHLNLSSNSFGGKIPTNLTYCCQLTVLNVVYNNLVGNIPDQLSSLSKLVVLGLGVNNFTGGIPTWIGNFSSLTKISLVRNNFEGSIPNEIGHLSGLEFFQLSANNLSGKIPSSLYNISSISFFSITQNKLHGHLPPDLGLTLPNLEFFACALNNFAGPIPVSLSNASKLQTLEFGGNGFTGSVPGNLGSLQGLVRLSFDTNRLGNQGPGDLDFLTLLANCTSLESLSLGGNLFGGELPSSITNLTTQLKFLTVADNFFHGRIPVGIGKLVNLTLLAFDVNYLSGSVPDDMARLQKLEALYLNDNKFSGPIPSSLGNLTRIPMLFMQENELEGSIPPHLGSCQNLQILNLSKNKLNGTIPKEVIGLSSLSIYLSVSHNVLTGPLPSEVGNLSKIVDLDVSNNDLSGKIPSTLGRCVSLQSLHLETNTFEGTIPLSLENLRGLEDLDLSHNNLSGTIPEFLDKFLFLINLNLSYNDFKGDIPRDGVFKNVSAFSVAGNKKLCGGVPELHLPTCSVIRPRGFRYVKVLVPSMIAFLLLILVCAFAAFMLFRKSRGRPAQSSLSEWLLDISYSEVVKSTNGFSEENLIGSGSFALVYKGVLSGDGPIVAIKVLNLEQRGASKSFVDECNALKSIRHRNLLRVITACSSVDHQGNDFKCLVFEFMSNGSLYQWLHERQGIGEQSQVNKLSFIQRLNIAIDVASALDYLHQQCGTPIVHCDLKPSNVLLDEDMTAHVGDFGLARFLFEPDDSPESQIITSGLKGSVGYIPPEYGRGGQVSELGDVYSFGVLLLETFTGKRPTDDIFQEDQSIQNFIEMALPGHAMNVVDPSMFDDAEEETDNLGGNDNARKHKEECLVSVLRIGLSCCATLPSERMPMNVVANKLHEVKVSFLRTKNRNRRRMR